MESKSKDTFLANLSHEFRSPINTIIGMNEMILRENQNETIKKYALSIESAATHLLSLVNEVLDYTKLSFGEIEIVEGKYGTDTLVQVLQDMFKYAAEKKDIYLRFDVSPTVPKRLLGDVLKIRQICINLLSNAIKYTDKGGIRFTLDCETTEEGVNLIISVKDTGIGIKEEDLKNLFSEFHRGDIKHNYAIEGTGLGLSIIKHLAEQMNGTVYVDSTYHSGSVFTVTIPQQEAKKTSNSFIAPSARILVVDDTPLNLKVIKGLLKRTEMQVDITLSGEDCIKRCRDNKYDVILLDDRMPDISGVETLRALKDTDTFPPETKVIALTGNTGDGLREQYLSYGFDDYLPKPVKAATLEKTISKYIPKEKITNVEIIPPTEKLPEWLLANKYIDVDEGLKMCGSREVFLGTLLGFSKIPEEPRSFANDEEIFRKIHSIKTIAGLVGCSSVHYLAWEIEKEHNKKKIPKLFVLCEEVAETLSPLTEKEAYPKTLEELDNDALPTLYRHLGEYVSDFNDEAVGSMLNALSRYEFPERERERFEMLKEAHKAADWIKMRELLN